MRIHHLINEIMEQKQNVPRKASSEIYKILDNNSKLFLQHVEPDVFQMILTRFEDLFNSNDFNNVNYKEEFEKGFNLLDFYLRKII